MNCQLDSSHLAFKSDPLALHWELAISCLVAWLEAGDVVTRDWWLESRGVGDWLTSGFGLGWLVTVIGDWRFSWLVG